MKKVSKSALKAKMFEYFRELEQTGEPLFVTDFGKPVLQIIPYSEKKPLSELFKDVRGQVKLNRSLVLAPTEEEWS